MDRGETGIADLLTTEQAARLLDVSVNTLHARTRLKTNPLAFVRLGWQKFFRVSDLRSWQPRESKDGCQMGRKIVKK